MGYQSGLSGAMKQLARNSELFKHSHFVASVCKQLIAVLPQNYLLIPSMNICLAALFHDLGKADWPEHWFYTAKQDLDDKELQTMKQHPELGAKILESLVPGVPREIIKLIANHHERPGGWGYPKELKEVSKETLVLAACDVYCACTETRGYRRKMLTSEEILESIAEFAPREILHGLRIMQEEGCHEHFHFSIGKEGRVTEIRF